MLGILSILIIVHEFGHFSVARLFGFQTPVFGFGLPFGPSWIIGRRWDTEFRIHAFLMGGYVAIPELGDESQTTQEAYGAELQPHRKFPIWKRALVAFAGVGFNILFAYLVMLFMMLMIGQPSQSTIVYALPSQETIAAKAGIKVGDRIVSVNQHRVADPDDVVKTLGRHRAEIVSLDILRDGKPMKFTLTTNESGKVGMALIGKGPMTFTPVEGNILEIAWLANVKLWTLTFNMLDALGQLFGSMIFGAEKGQPQLGVGDLHGVVAVVKIGADIAQTDWSQLFLFTIMISMDLAIINLLPWPALDGGHLMFMAVEAVRGRPMGERTHGEIVKWGFISLIILMVLVLVNDVTALVEGKLDFKRRAGQRESQQEKKGPRTLEGGQKKAPENVTTAPGP